MRKSVYALITASVLVGCSTTEKGEAPVPPYTLSESKNTTPTYEEGIRFWQEMADYYPEIAMHKYGTTDAGKPLHLVVIDGERPRPIDAYKSGQKQLLLINNAIHPGEPDGVDASMLLAHDLMENKAYKSLLSKTSIIIIPFYNIGGALNRNSYSRANQNGPEEYGFRGNAQNLDLNRDFIKCDSRNALTFATLINDIDPDLYIETHVSNGADYPYVMTYLSTQEDKMGGTLTDKLRKEWTPFMEKEMGEAGFGMAPYVNVHGESPENGYATFYDQPRYSTGFLALRGIPGYITETHMLKPYQQRVEATLSFLRSGVKLLHTHRVRDEIDRTRLAHKNTTEFPLDWALDSAGVSAMVFDGYTASYKPSEVSGANRLYYDRDKPYSAKIPYWGVMKPTKLVTAPAYYVLRRGFTEVEERLRANGVEMIEVTGDTALEAEVYHLKKFETSQSPYEKHYFHYGTEVSAERHTINVRKGDWIIPLDNNLRRFVVEVLEPTGPDSYFNWNFFDAVLQQKEWYSAYVFEDEAADLLENDAELKTEFEKYVKEFNPPARGQLYWIYMHSKRYEKEHLLYPVYRVL